MTPALAEFPIKGKLRFEVDEIESLERGARYGQTVRIGKTDWCLVAKTECSDNTDSNKYLGIYLRCLHDFEMDESIESELKIRLINQSTAINDHTKGRTNAIYKKNDTSWGIANFIEWISVMNDGYLKNGKIIVECEINILSETIGKEISIKTSLESFVYPVKGKLRYEFDDIESLGDRYGNAVRIGQTDWCLEVECENSENTGNEKYLCVYLRCFHKFGTEETIRVKRAFRILNQVTLGNNFEKAMSVVTYEKDAYSWGLAKFMKWTKLLNDGYEKNEKIIVECEFDILSEKISKTQIDYESSRPDNEDLKSMLMQKRYKIEKKFIEKEFELSQISNDTTFSHIVYIDGIPCKIGIRKENLETKDWLSIYLYCNSEDKSEWWRVEATSEFRIKNRNEINKFFSKSTSPHLFQSKTSNWGPSEFIKWSELIDPKNGYVKYGRFLIETIVSIRNKYGFDEETGKGIDKPMIKMTDAIISVGGEQFYISRMILSHQSSWFCDLFSTDPNKTEFVLSDVDKNLFTKFLQLAYNIKVDINEDNIEALLELLDKYKANECIRRCDYLMKDMNVTDLRKMWKLIDKYPLPKMKARFANKIEKIFPSIDAGKLTDFLREVLSLEGTTESEDDSTNEPYYSYSKQADIPTEVSESKEQFRKFLLDNYAKRLLSDPELQNVGNVLLSLLSDEPINSKPQIPFKEFSDRGDLIVFIMNDGKKFYSSKQIMAHSSRYFMKRFFGPDARDDDNTIAFPDISSQDFNLLLNHIYHPTKSVTDKNLNILLPLAHRFSVMDLLEKCEKYLIQANNLSVSERENYAKNYNLTYLFSACTNYAERK